MFRGPSFIVSTMQEETTPIFKRLWYDWTQQQPGIEPTNPLGQRWVPPIVAFYDQQGLLRTYSLPGGSIRNPHPGSPRGKRVENVNIDMYVEGYLIIGPCHSNSDKHCLQRLGKNCIFSLLSHCNDRNGQMSRYSVCRYSVYIDTYVEG